MYEEGLVDGPLLEGNNLQSPVKERRFFYGGLPISSIFHHVVGAGRCLYEVICLLPPSTNYRADREKVEKGGNCHSRPLDDVTTSN